MATPIVYLMHIPKTAGMSLQGLVRRRYKKPGSLKLIYDQESVEKGFTDQPELELVMGHFRFGYHSFSDRPAQYITFLREPLQQVISHYQYTKDHSEKFEYLPAGINSLLDFASCPYGYNLQTRFISGIDNLHGREEEALKLAGRHLKNDFELIGLTERFDLSLLMLGRAMHWNICYYVRGNTGIARQTKPAPSKQELSELRQILAPDIALYQEARQLFEVQTQKWPDLVKRLPSFQRENHYFQKLNPAYIRLKQLFKG